MSTNQPKNLVTTDQSGDESRKVAVRAAAKKQCFSITLSRKEIEKDLFAISNLTQKKLHNEAKYNKSLTSVHYHASINLTRRPKKISRDVQKELDHLFLETLTDVERLDIELTLWIAQCKSNSAVVIELEAFGQEPEVLVLQRGSAQHESQCTVAIELEAFDPESKMFCSRAWKQLTSS
ncbi:hypothetical protein POUND7_008238, partial [Theobroma cacao]